MSLSNTKITRFVALTIMVLFIIVEVTGMPDNDVEYEVSLTGNTSSGEFAPYFISALNHGKISQKQSVLADIKVEKETSDEGRFSFGFGVEMLGGATSANEYGRWDEETDSWTLDKCKPASAWVQQLYAEIRYRSVFLSAGLKEHTPAFLNPSLSSGDFIESGNARPIPEVRAGFRDFVDIPLTNGWVQIMCQLSYGYKADDKFIKERYNYYNYHIAEKSLYSYKCCFFRSNPEQRLMVSAGMQAGALFGGKAQYYGDGKFLKENVYNSDFKSFLNILLPVFNNEEDFAQGSTVGSWDFFSQYLLNNDDEICAYFQWPFEDGSGIGRRNKFDGIWGVEYRRAKPGIINELVVEYIDFRDQSGPIHFAPDDYNNPSMNEHVSGRDNYYNNGYYNSYANYGMSIGTPFLVAPIYNLDGYPAFTSNRANGFHLGVAGDLSQKFSYRMLFGYQRGMGTYDKPFTQVRTDTSMMFEGLLYLGQFRVKGQVAYDTGTLRGKNFGTLVSLIYNGIFGR